MTRPTPASLGRALELVESPLRDAVRTLPEPLWQPVAYHFGWVNRDGEELDPSDPMSPEAQWDALARISCPTLVVRGAASDILSADTADKMVDEVLPDGRLAVVPLAGHSVMTDNPEGFEEALSPFLLEEE